MVIDQIRNVFFLIFKELYADLSFDLPDMIVTVSTQKKFGHYQCNAVMKLAKKANIPARVMADRVDAYIQTHKPPMLDRAEVAGPGFINLWLNPEFVAEQLHNMLLADRFALKEATPKKIVVDFSSPNIAKQMHVGHLRSTIIGDSIARLYRFLGHDVLGLNHIGDWGTAFGMLIAYLTDEKLDQSSMSVPDLLTHYRAAKARFDDDDAFKQRARHYVTRLQQRDQVCLQLWEKICAISRLDYQKIYDLLNITDLEERGESFYHAMLPGIVADFTKKNLVTLSQGAQCVFMAQFKQKNGETLPLMIQKSDGGYNYTTTDLAALKQRVQQEQAEIIIYVTDLGQRMHFDMVFSAARLVGYLSPKTAVHHVGFGLVLGEDGKKLKTRSGAIVPLIDLLSGAVNEAKNILRARDNHLPEKEVEEKAKILGINAVKYADLSCSRQHDYQFSFARMLRFEGNTASYLMYAYARIASIKEKAGKKWQMPKKQLFQITHDTEFTLALHLMRFPEALDAFERDSMPNRLTDYLYQLAEYFHVFFHDCQVLGSENESERLLFCMLTYRILRQGFLLLGLQLLENM